MVVCIMEFVRIEWIPTHVTVCQASMEDTVRSPQISVVERYAQMEAVLTTMLMLHTNVSVITHTNWVSNVVQKMTIKLKVCRLSKMRSVICLVYSMIYAKTAT